MAEVDINEKIIELVRNEPILYDIESKFYHDSKKKDRIWEKIGKECGISTVAEIKAIWKKLRDAHRVALKKYQTKSGQSAAKIKPWVYHHQMSFLQVFMKDRTRVTNEELMVSDDFGSVDVSTAEPASEPADDVCEEEGEPITIAKKISVASKIQKKANDPYLALLAEEARKRNERSHIRDEKRKELESSNDGLKLFFDAMYMQTKQLPVHAQRKIKRVLFEAVASAEEASDMEQNTSTANVPSNASTNYLEFPSVYQHL